MSRDEKKSKADKTLQAGLDPLPTIPDEVLEARFWGQSLTDAARAQDAQNEETIPLKTNTYNKNAQDVDFDPFAETAILPDQQQAQSPNQTSSEKPSPVQGADDSAHDPFAAFVATELESADSQTATYVGPLPDANMPRSVVDQTPSATVGVESTAADLAAKAQSLDVDFSEFDAQASLPKLDPLPPTAYPLPPAVQNDPAISDNNVDTSPAGLDFFGEADSSSPLLSKRDDVEKISTAAREQESKKRVESSLEDEFFSTPPQAFKEQTPSSPAAFAKKNRPDSVASASRDETRFAVAVLSALEPRLEAETQTALWSLVNKISEAFEAVISGRMQSLRKKLAESKKVANISAGMQRDSALLSLIIVPQLSFAKQLTVVVVYDPQRAQRQQAFKAMREVNKDLARDDVNLRWRLIIPEGPVGPARRLAACGVVLHGLIPLEFLSAQSQQDCEGGSSARLRQWGLMRDCVSLSIQRENSRVHPLAIPKRALATSLWRWASQKQMALTAINLRESAQENEAHALWLDQDALFTAASAPLLAHDKDLGDAVARLIPIFYKGAAGRALLRMLHLPQPLFSPNKISREEVFLPFEILDARLGIALDLALEQDLDAWMQLRRPQERFYPRCVQREISGAKNYDRIILRRNVDAEIETQSAGDAAQVLTRGALVEDALAQLWTLGHIDRVNKLRPSADLLDRQPKRILKALLKTSLEQRAGLLCLTTQHPPGSSPKLSELDVEAVWIALDRGSARVQDLGRQRGFGWLDVCVQHNSSNLRVLSMGGSHSWVLAELVQSVLDALRDNFDVLFEHEDGLALLDRGGVQILQGSALQRRMAKPGALAKVRVIGSSSLVQLVRQTAKQRSDSVHIFLGREAGVAVLDARRRAYLRPGKKAEISQIASDLLEFLKSSGFDISATVHDAQQFYAKAAARGLAIRLDYSDKVLQSLWIDGHRLPLQSSPLALCAQEILARTPARKEAQFFIESLQGFSGSPVLALRARSLFQKKISNKIKYLKKSFKKS